MTARVYDCFTFNNEYDVLKIRLNELSSVVDRFVVVEGTRTFSGINKKLTFDYRHPAIAGFEDQIDLVVVNDWPDTTDPWARESWQRSAMQRGLLSARPDDLVIIGDVDEIPRSHYVAQCRDDYSISYFGFAMNMYYFYFNYKSIHEDGSPKRNVWSIASRYSNLLHHTTDQLRYAVRFCQFPSMTIENAGWHFSYLMDDEAIKKKIQNFSHQEFNTPEILGQINIKSIVANSADLFGRSHEKWNLVSEDDLPGWLKNHQSEYQNYFG